MPSPLGITRTNSALHSLARKGEMRTICLEGSTERSDSNRVRSARIGEPRTMCLEFSCKRAQSRTCSGYAECSRKSRRSGTTPQDMPPHCISANSCDRPGRHLSIATIRANFFDIFGCARHNSNKFGFALACTKIRANSWAKKHPVST